MDVSRRSLLGGALVLVVLTSGCLGFLTGSEPLVLTAEDANVADAALSQTEFELQETRSAWVNRTVQQAGQEREIRVRNHVSVYRRPVAMDVESGLTFGFFVVVSTPKASVAGQALNPIGQTSHEQLIGQLAGQSGDISEIEREDSRSLTVLGSDADVVRFSGIVERSGQEVPVYIEVARVEDGDDFVVGIGAYPQGTADQVRPGITTLFEGIEH